MSQGIVAAESSQRDHDGCYASVWQKPREAFICSSSRRKGRIADGVKNEMIIY